MIDSKLHKNVAARVTLFESHDHRGRSGLVMDGTLGQAIQKVMEMEPEEQNRAAVNIPEGIIPDKSLLRIDDIRELASRPEFA